MHYARTAAQYAVAIALIVLGVIGVIATHTQYIPCEGVEQFAPACADAMDVPEHFGVLQQFWVIALALTVVAIALARGRAARWVAVGAAGLVLVMNSVTEYLIWLAVWGGHWDVPPGTGYSMAGAMILSGLLVTVSATLGLAPRSVTRPLVTAVPDDIASLVA
ncbi:MAG: hypothetical protein DI566_11950 [Microbacterium sp.]|nr:MAG: hypothetical protein DI566_11950 [Microbacterium sp.]